MNALYLIILTLIAGSVALYVITRKERRSNQTQEEIIIPLAEIATIWTRHNTGVATVPVKQESNDNKNNVVMYGLKKPEKLQRPDKENNGDEEKTTPKTVMSTGLSMDSLTEQLRSLWEDCILPYNDIIKNQGAETVLMEVLQILETHGHCPSVVIDNKDDESLDMITVRDNLVKVSLKEHTYAVCRYIIGNLKETFKDYEIMVPAALISSLAHDIGKIPELRLSGAYNSKDHAKVSAYKLSELLEESDMVWKKRAIRAVNDHHTATKDELTSLLKQSDRQARQSELSLCTREYEIKPFSEWFDLKKYLTEYVAPGVNVSQTGKWNAFSFRGGIYARPDWLYDQARIMCHHNKILDLLFIYTSEKDNAIRMIVNAMRHENITPLLGVNYPARKFDIRTSVQVKKLPAMYLTAFTIPDYINTIEMESRKSGFTEIIDTVLPI